MVNKFGVDFDAVPRKALRDVEEYAKENKIELKAEEITPREFLKYWLEWNGIFRYTDDIVRLMEGLGWKNPNFEEPKASGKV